MPKIMKKVPYVIPFFLRKTHPEVNCQKLKSTMPKKKNTSNITLSPIC